METTEAVGQFQRQLGGLVSLPRRMGAIMKIKDVEVSNYKDCPLRDLCNTVHCGSPDTCLFCSMSDEELEMEVDDYIEKQEARIERHERMMDRIEAERRHKSEVAKKAAATRHAVSMDRTVIIKKSRCKELEKLINSKLKIQSFVGAVNFANKLMYNTPENPSVKTIQIEIDSLEGQYKKLVQELKEAEYDALIRIRKENKMEGAK